MAYFPLGSSSFAKAMLLGPFGAFETIYFGLPGASTVALEVIAPPVPFPGASNLPADLPPIGDHSAAVADFGSNYRCCKTQESACNPSKVSLALADVHTRGCR